MRPEGPRDPVSGPDSGPESPFPVRLSGPVIKGFGRGSKDVCDVSPSIPVGVDMVWVLIDTVYIARDPYGQHLGRFPRCASRAGCRGVLWSGRVRP